MYKEKIIKLLGNVVFYGLILIFISTSVFMLKLKENGIQPSIFGNKFFIVLTGSMSPTIEVGDLIVVKDVTPKDIQENDVITFKSKSSDNITTHRVKEVLNDSGNISYITKGDANNIEDPIPVESEVLLGRVRNVVPKLGTIILWIQKHIVLLLIALVALIIGSYITTKILKSYSNKDNNIRIDI